MVVVLGALALVFTVFGFWSERFEEDPEEANRGVRESWRAMPWPRRFEMLSMVCVGSALIFDGLAS